MKLRSISLTNIRRFAGQTLILDDLSDGLNVLAAPNEFGKSTILDAVFALFFVGHRSTGREIQALTPPSRGAIGVTVDIDHQQRLWRVTKRWAGAKGTARVEDATSGAIVAQGDGAEDWLRALIGDAARGPAGLIWVRQGQGALEADKGPRLEGRRDVLTAVSGEVDQMIGGRRFDRVAAAVGATLDGLVLKNDKPKTGGAWKVLLDRTAELEQEQALRTRQVTELSGALQTQRAAQQRLAALHDPAGETQLMADAHAARALLAAAEDHARLRATADSAAALARHLATQADVEFSRHTVLADALATAIAGQTACAAALAAAQAQSATVLAARLSAATQATETAARLDLLHSARQAADRHADAARARQALAEVTARLERAEATRLRVETAESRVTANLATPDRLARLRVAEAQHDGAVVALRAAAAVLEIRHLGDVRLQGPDGPVADGPLALTGTLTLTLPGLLALQFRPGAGTGLSLQAAADRAEASLAALLSEIGVTDAGQARTAAAARQQSAEDGRLAGAELRFLAPDGLPALRAELARLSAIAGGAPDDARLPDIGPDLATDIGPDALRMATQARDDAVRQIETHVQMQIAAAQSLARAESAARQADDVLQAARLAHGPDEAYASRRADLNNRAVQARQDAALADGRARDLALREPDARLAAAALARAESALAALHKDRAAEKERLTTASALIAARAEDGVEERLSELDGELAALRRQAAAQAADVDALIHLRDVLAATRADQHAAYFGPVQAELAPMLALLHGAADMAFDPGALLPGQLTRGGLTETIDSLSGGTQEQIAILTRLAFARLLARSGRPVPVILDDALVYSDDDRIGQMFTALHHVAADQQIIILTCRQLAFQRLGGHRPRVRLEAAD